MKHRHPHLAFTLIELLVSMAVLSLILVLTLGMTNNVSSLFTRTRARIDTFQEARAGFESMTRRVSQAMLNTYWDYEYAANDTTRSGNPRAYARQSELHFISGPAKAGASPLLPDNAIQSLSHALFFQAPTGYSTSAQSGTLNNLLNATGYYISYGSDRSDRPKFLRTSLPDRFRFRLHEMNQPTENLGVFNKTQTEFRDFAESTKWFRSPLALAHSGDSSTEPQGLPPATRTLADNIVALIILPHRSPNDPITAGQPGELAPTYAYDSRLYAQPGGGSTLGQLSRNQLPPLVQITMVAIDEASAARMASFQADPATMSDTLGIGSLFQRPSTSNTPSPQELGKQYRSDLAELEKKLQSERVNYRIFSTVVSILQAKWSEN